MEAFSAVMQEMDIGAQSDPFLTQFGWHIWRWLTAVNRMLAKRLERVRPLSLSTGDALRKKKRNGSKKFAMNLS